MSIYGPLEHLGVPVAIQSALLAGVLLIASGFLVRRQIAASNGGLIPDEGFSIRNVCEIVVEFLADLAEANMGEDWRRYFPLVGTIFFFILISNLLGLLPGIGGTTSFIETTLGWALISFVVSEGVGIHKHGMSYVKHFLGPLPVLAPFFFILEVPLHFARVLTLAIRLLANMFADHTIIAVWMTLVPVVIPAIFMGLGLLVAVLQAFVFALLTMIYIGLSLEEAH